MAAPQSHNIKFYENLPVGGSRAGSAEMTDGRTDISKIICAFCNLGERASKLFCDVQCASVNRAILQHFFLVRQHWYGCRYCHFSASFKAF